jgi:hypothetical protein
MDRYGRQTRLAEVGVQGRARIAAARADVPLGGLASAVAARYLAGAGVGRVRVTTDAVAVQARAIDGHGDVAVEVDPAMECASPSAPSFLALRDASAAAVALGAHTALVALRRILGVGA